jgi:hypothetical protein
VFPFAGHRHAGIRKTHDRFIGLLFVYGHVAPSGHPCGAGAVYFRLAPLPWPNSSSEHHFQ